MTFFSFHLAPLRCFHFLDFFFFSFSCQVKRHQYKFNFLYHFLLFLYHYLSDKTAPVQSLISSSHTAVFSFSCQVKQHQYKFNFLEPHCGTIIPCTNTYDPPSPRSVENLKRPHGQCQQERTYQVLVNDSSSSHIQFWCAYPVQIRESRTLTIYFLLIIRNSSIPAEFHDPFNLPRSV